MISDFKQLEDLFKEIDKQLSDKVSIYVIGGAVLLYQGLKPATKDIDLILDDKETYEIFVNTLKNIEFKKKDPTGIYKKMGVNSILERSDFRIDAFLKTVCKKVQLSKEMKARAKSVIKLDSLDILLCSNEDIFIFKSMTEREGDLEDCISLVQRGIDWDIILKELQEQIQYSGQDVWITWIGERLDLLEDKGITIPIMNEINKLRDKYFEELEKEFLENPRRKNRFQ